VQNRQCQLDNHKTAIEVTYKIFARWEAIVFVAFGCLVVLFLVSSQSVEYISLQERRHLCHQQETYSSNFATRWAPSSQYHVRPSQQHYVTRKGGQSTFHCVRGIFMISNFLSPSLVEKTRAHTHTHNVCRRSDQPQNFRRRRPGDGGRCTEWRKQHVDQG
jgi:hypothetical protein